jgi:hypothetical protein
MRGVTAGAALRGIAVVRGALDLAALVRAVVVSAVLSVLVAAGGAGEPALVVPGSGTPRS